ncbi:unnamed protein product [Rhizophagus irregularis]|nr:unnamed protein product [Rhizophagus irregularis]
MPTPPSPKSLRIFRALSVLLRKFTSVIMGRKGFITLYIFDLAVLYLTLPSILLQWYYQNCQYQPSAQSDRDFLSRFPRFFPNFQKSSDDYSLSPEQTIQASFACLDSTVDLCSCSSFTTLFLRSEFSTSRLAFRALSSSTFSSFRVARCLHASGNIPAPFQHLPYPSTAQ